jgi:hypothetical protein
VSLYSNKEFLHEGELESLMGENNVYKLLGIRSTEKDPHAIQDAFNRKLLAQENSGDQETSIRDAYAIISDPARREQYDATVFARTVDKVESYYNSLPSEEAKESFRAECANTKNRIAILQSEKNFRAFASEVIVGASDLDLQKEHNLVSSFVTDLYNLNKDFIKRFIAICGLMGTGKSTVYPAVILCAITGFNIDAVMPSCKNAKLIKELVGDKLKSVISKFSKDSPRVYEKRQFKFPLYLYVSTPPPLHCLCMCVCVCMCVSSRW